MIELQAIAEMLRHHQVISTVATFWIVSAFISSLPAPTATSSGFYQFFFKFSNTLGGNLLRALSTAVENSPNFTAAAKLIGLPAAPEAKP